MSQQSTLLVTQMLYDNHDEVERQAMNMALRLAKEYMFDEDTIVQVFNEGMDEELVKIPGKSLKKADFDIIMQSNSRQETARTELMQMALQNYKAGVLPFSNFISLYNTESLKELEMMGKYFDEQAREIQMQMQQSQGEQAMALEEKKSQLAMQMAEYSEKMHQQTEQMKMEYDKAKEQSAARLKEAELQIRMKELELKQSELEQNKILKGYELANKKSSEDNALIEGQRSKNLDIQIELIQADLKRLELSMKKQADDRKAEIDMQKVKKSVTSSAL
jgi:hypothetical protein